MRAFRAVIVCMLSVTTLVAWGAHAQVRSTDTLLQEAFTAIPIDLAPGLCAPGDTPGCIGPEIAQFRLEPGPMTTCFYNGIFEGKPLPVNASCDFELYGFMTGLTPGSKPACGAARFYTSDETTAFGENKANVLVINGVARSIFIEGASLGATATFTKVEIDDADEDDDPTGDHIEIAPPAPIIRQSGTSGVSCVTQPLTLGLLVAGGGTII